MSISREGVLVTWGLSERLPLRSIMLRRHDVLRVEVATKEVGVIFVCRRR